MRTVLLVPLVATLAGCVNSPDHRVTQISIPVAYAHADAVAASDNFPPAVALEGWWRVFGDGQLDSLIIEAAMSNHDMLVAQSRALEARAWREISRSGLFPQVGGAADHVRRRDSENTLIGRQLAASGQPAENDLFALGLEMSWEVDLFGGNRRALEAAHAEWEASIEAHRAVLVTVLAEVGLAYFDLRGAQKQISVARDNLRAQEQTLALTRDRLRAGLATELDTARAEAQVANTRAQIPPLEELRERSVHRLGVLLGKPPRVLAAQLAAATPLPAVPRRVPIGLPSDLLRPRPDILRAERHVAVASAQIRGAIADLFPRFYLTGAAGLQSFETGDLFKSGSRFWSLGPGVRWPLFTAGR